MPFKFDLLADYVDVIRTTAISPCDKSQIRSEKIRSTWMQRRLFENSCVCAEEERRRIVVRVTYPNAATCPCKKIWENLVKWGDTIKNKNRIDREVSTVLRGSPELSSICI
jgi:hypothetical protein